MHWIINSLAFIGTLALAAITIFVWACWRDATKQPTRPRQTKPGGTSGRHGPGGPAGRCSLSSASRSAARPGSGSTGAQTTNRRQPRTSGANRQHTSSAAAAQPGRPTDGHGASPVFSPSTHTTALFGHRIHTLRHQHRQAWDQAMRVKQAQDLAAFYAALAMAEEAGRAHGRDGREASRS